jgi:hypothetical protein
MSKTALTVFLCTRKDCRKAWRRVCDNSPGKWLRRQVADAGLPYKLKIVKTDCMDRCERAANLCFVCGPCACFESDVRSAHDADRLLAALRSCVEGSSVSCAPPNSTLARSPEARA